LGRKTLRTIFAQILTVDPIDNSATVFTVSNNPETAGCYCSSSTKSWCERYSPFGG